jgi:hypothetical protein
MYQKLLKEVPNWSDAMSKQHTDNIANRCAWFNDLLAAVFVSCVKILSAVRLSKDNKKISLKLPTNEVFIQMCHNKVAESLYNDPYVYHETQNEYARNDKLFERFSICVENAVKELIPVQQILQTYMSQSQEGQDLDLGDAEIADSEDPELIEDGGEEVTQDPFNPELNEEPSMSEEPSMGGEPSMSEEPSMGGEPSMVGEPSMGEEPYVRGEPTNSFMNNEFKTINTTPQARESMASEHGESDDVFFPDAAESRQKNIMYK